MKKIPTSEGSPISERLSDKIEFDGRLVARVRRAIDQISPQGSQNPAVQNARDLINDIAFNTVATRKEWETMRGYFRAIAGPDGEKAIENIEQSEKSFSY